MIFSWFYPKKSLSTLLILYTWSVLYNQDIYKMDNRDSFSGSALQCWFLKKTRVDIDF